MLRRLSKLAAPLPPMATPCSPLPCIQADRLRRRPPRCCPQAGLLAASGACLALHFGLWVYSVQATSLTHSLLFVSATPLFLAGGTWALGRPISAGELGGTAVGLAGGVVLATAAARSDAQVGRGGGRRGGAAGSGPRVGRVAAHPGCWSPL